MIRITDLNILCPICGKPDWDLVSDCGRFAACKRVKDGSICDLGALGYLHFLPNGIDVSKVQKRTKPEVTYDEWKTLQSRFANAVSHFPDVGLPNEALLSYGIGWNPDGNHWTFPMYDLSGNICGMSSRFQDGTKACIKGSRAGVFLPRLKYNNRVWCIAEGATDAAAIWSLGYNCIGKFNRDSPHQLISDICRYKINLDAVVVVADNDDVGREGAQKLVELLKNQVITKLLVPPPQCKDIRQAVLRGLSSDKFHTVIAKLLRS